VEVVMMMMTGTIITTTTTTQKHQRHCSKMKNHVCWNRVLIRVETVASNRPNTIFINKGTKDAYIIDILISETLNIT
jgi:hypothetical protein